MPVPFTLVLAALAMIAVATADGAWSAAARCKGAACGDSAKDKTKGKGGRRGGNVEFEWKVEEGELSKRRRGLKTK